MRNAEILFPVPADAATETISDPEPISLSKAEFCQLLVDMASKGLLDVLRKEAIMAKIMTGIHGVRQASIGTKFEETGDFSAENISDFYFRRTMAASERVNNPINKYEYGKLRIRDSYRPLAMNVKRMKRWAPYFFVFFLGVFLFLNGTVLWWYVSDQINLTTFLILVGVFGASGASACVFSRKHRHSDTVVVRRICVID